MFSGSQSLNKIFYQDADTSLVCPTVPTMQRWSQLPPSYEVPEEVTRNKQIKIIKSIKVHV